MTASAEIGGTQQAGAAPAVTPRRLYRSRSNRTFAGVCAGVAAYFGADVSAIRLATLVLAVLTGIFPGIVLYVVAAVVIPEEPASEAAEPPIAAGPGQGTLLLGLILVIVGTAALAGQVFRVGSEVLGPAGLIAIGAVIAALAYRR